METILLVILALAAGAFGALFAVSRVRNHTAEENNRSLEHRVTVIENREAARRFEQEQEEKKRKSRRAAKKKPAPKKKKKLKVIKGKKPGPQPAPAAEKPSAPRKKRELPEPSLAG